MQKFLQGLLIILMSFLITVGFLAILLGLFICFLPPSSHPMVSCHLLSEQDILDK